MFSLITSALITLGVGPSVPVDPFPNARERTLIDHYSVTQFDAMMIRARDNLSPENHAHIRDEVRSRLP